MPSVGRAVIDLEAQKGTTIAVDSNAVTRYIRACHSSIDNTRQRKHPPLAAATANEAIKRVLPSAGDVQRWYRAFLPRATEATVRRVRAGVAARDHKRPIYDATCAG